MKKKYLIIGGTVLVLGVVIKAFLKRPKGKIIINKDGTGTVQLGSHTVNFEKNMGAVVKNWNGWELSAGASSMTLTHFGKVIENGAITEYYGGSSDVEIVHIK